VPLDFRSMKSREIAFDRRHGGAAPDGYLDFSASLNPLGPPREALEAYHAAVDRIASYPPPYPVALEAKFAETIGLPPSCVMAGNGSMQLIYVLARVMRARCAHVVLPTFSEIANGLALARSDCSPVMLRAESDFELELSAIDAALAAGADAIWIGRPNSPTGTLINHDELIRIVEQCERHHARLVIDEAFIDFTHALSAARLVSKFRHVIVLRSLTKSHAIAGLRLGFVVADPELATKLRDNVEPWSVNVVAEAVGLACLNASSEYLHRTRETIDREREFIARELAATDRIRIFPSAANFLMLQVTGEATPGDFGSDLLRHKIVVRDLAELPGCSAGMYRVAVRMRTDNERLIAAAREALARLRRA
jgi:threonine-phosphate decarboxylase